MSHRTSRQLKISADARHRTAERKVRVGFAFALACLVAVAALSYASVQHLRTGAAWVEHTHEVLTHLNRILALTTDAETAERGYVITGDEDYRSIYAATVRNVGQVEQELQKLTADNALQRQRLDRLSALIGDRIATLGAIDETRRREGFGAARELIRDGPGKQIHAELRQQVEEIADVERSLLRERQHRVDASTTTTLLIGIGSSLLALVCVAWSALVSHRDLTERRRIEAEREGLQTHLALQLEDMRRLHDLSAKLVEVHDLPKMLEELLKATIELQRADFGNVQLYDPQSDSLRIVAQHGFSREFLDHFRTVRADEPSVCGRALQQRARVVVEDVEQDVQFAPHGLAASEAGFRGVQSTPILGRDATVKGMLSTHFREPHRPSDRDLQMTDLYLHTAAHLIERVQDVEMVREARDEADRANEAKGRFLSTASHDLRQPLQTLSLLNGALSRLISEGDAAEAIEQQQQAITAMSGLVNALLDISKLQSGAIRPEIGSFTLDSLFAELRAESHEPARRKGLALDIVASDQSVTSDRTLLGQILRNLLGNAIRYTYSGSIRLQCLHDGERLRIEVADTGIGIPEEHLAYIFDEFYQVRGPHNGAREGHGLGLNIVKRTARLLNHELTVQSRVGKGSVFAIYLRPGETEQRTRHPAQLGTSLDVKIQQAHVLGADFIQSARQVSEHPAT